jgi:hypothetical protein
MRHLFLRHHLLPQARAGGRAGLRDAIGMLQGFEIAAASWEPDVLLPRVAGYRREWLDELCTAGEVTYCRLSPRRPRVRLDDGIEGVGGQISTSRATRLAIARRRDLGWLLQAVRGRLEPESATAPGAIAALEALRKHGAGTWPFRPQRRTVGRRRARPRNPRRLPTAEGPDGVRTSWSPKTRAWTVGSRTTARSSFTPGR